MNLDSFYKAPKDLRRSWGFIGKGGKVVEFTLAARTILEYMIDRTAFFNGNHYETQETIGFENGMEVKAAARALKLLVEGGAIEASKERNLQISQHKCWYYKKVNLDIQLIPYTDRAKYKGVPVVSAAVTDQDDQTFSEFDDDLILNG